MCTHWRANSLRTNLARHPHYLSPLQRFCNEVDLNPISVYGTCIIDSCLHTREARARILYPPFMGSLSACEDMLVGVWTLKEMELT